MFTFTTDQQRVVDFDQRCQIVANYLHRGRLVTMTEAQLKFYRVTPHEVVKQLIYWVKAEETARTFIVYCTKRGDKYIFTAKVK